MLTFALGRRRDRDDRSLRSERYEDDTETKEDFDKDEWDEEQKVSIRPWFGSNCFVCGRTGLMYLG